MTTLTFEDTTTQTQEEKIRDLKQQVSDAGREERQLALEQDSMPELLANAAREDARAKAAAARSGEAPATVEDGSDVPSLLLRQRNLPYLMWSAAVRKNALEVELHDAQIQEQEQRAREAQSGLEGLRLDMEEATRKYEEKLSAYRGAEYAVDALTSRRATFQRELRLLEAQYPNA